MLQQPQNSRQRARDSSLSILSAPTTINTSTHLDRKETRHGIIYSSKKFSFRISTSSWSDIFLRGRRTRKGPRSGHTNARWPQEAAIPFSAGAKSIKLTHSFLTAKQFFPGFLYFSMLFKKFQDLNKMPNSHLVLHKETWKQHFEKQTLN